MKKILLYKILKVLVLYLLAGVLFAQNESVGSSNLEITPASNNNENAIIRNKKIPEGFLELLEPETNAVDVYFGNRLIVTTIAKFNPNYIEFLIPEEITNNISELKEKHVFFKHISVPMSPNTSKICASHNKNNCGLLKPDLAAVIFNKTNFRVDLFINPILLSKAGENSKNYLSASNIPYSYVNNFSVTGTGDSETQDVYTISGQSIFSNKQNRLQMIWDYSEENEQNIDSLSFQMDRLDMEYEAGFFSTKSKSINFIPDVDILGVKVGTTLKTRTDLMYAKGSPINVFFSNRSRVEIYRKDVLIDVQFYDVGNQVIDTSNFPDGAYDVEFRITDTNGLKTNETHFFAKSARLPPSDAPQLAFEAGRVTEAINTERTLPTLNESNFTRISLQQRVMPDLGFEGALTMFSEQGYIEAGFIKLSPSIQLSSGLLASTENDYGASFDLRYQNGDFSSNLGLRRIYSDTDNPFIVSNNQSYDPIQASSTTLNTSVNYRSTIGAVGLQWIRRRPENQNLSETYLFNFQRSILSFSDSVISLYVEAGKVKDIENEFETDIEIPVDKEFYSIGIQAHFSKKHWHGNFASNYRDDLLVNPNGDGVNVQESGAEYALEIGWKDLDYVAGDLESNIFARKNLFSDIVGLGFGYDSYLARSDFIVQESKSHAGNSQQWSGNLSFAVVGNTDSIAIGGQRRGDSAIIAEIEGDADNAYFDVVVNGYDRGSLGIGRKNIIGLPAYDDFDVALKPKGDSFVNFSNDSKQTTLYPGNVATFKWKANQVYLIYGRILDLEGNPIKHAKIIDVPGWAASNQYGIFQTEIFSDTTTLRFEVDKKFCKIDLPAFIENDGVVAIGDLVCELVTEAQ